MTTTFTEPPSVHTLRMHVLMEKQHRMEIGQRIRELRENSAETNRSIADYVGVGERSVAAWLAGGGIAYDNAKKVAELFGVDVDYIWRGTQRTQTPDLMATLNGDAPASKAQVERLERKVDVLLDHFDLAELEQLAAEEQPVRGSTRKARRRGVS